MKRLRVVFRIAAFVAHITLCLTGQTKKFAYGPRDKAHYANPQLVSFARPGLAIKINSAGMSSAGAVSVTYTITDPSGMPLDATGETTPGAVALTCFAAYIPKGQEQYVAYTPLQLLGPNWELSPGPLSRKAAARSLRWARANTPT